jgi:hypothetical protein
VFVAAISCSPAALGFRATNLVMTGSSKEGYFFYVESYGLIDHCTITMGGGGTTEPIFAVGPTDSWQTSDSMGGSAGLFVEACTIGGVGYVCDVNNNGRGVFRFNSILNSNKIDAHGYCTNSLRGVRQMEIYGNHWVGSIGFWWAMELRGGTGRVFSNITDNGNSSQVELELKDYLYITGNSHSLPYQTPYDYPLQDQIGVGQDPKVAASSPYYLWGNTKAGGRWANLVDNSEIAAAAQTQYATDISSPGATFVVEDVIKADRDYFIAGATFDGSSGVGTGTKAQMLAITPSKTGVGFWVTNEGTWNNTLPLGTSGRLYAWDGAHWVLKYEPFTYPHPLAGGAIAQAGRVGTSALLAQ